MGVEYAPASLSLTHDSTELYCTCTYARGLSVRVAQEGVKVPVMVHVSVHHMVISEWSKCNLRAGI